MRKNKDYIVNKYWTKALGKNHKKHLSIAIIEKESQGIAKNNDAIGNEYIESTNNKILRYIDYQTMITMTRKEEKKKRTYYR